MGTLATGLVIAKQERDSKEIYSLVEYDSDQDHEETLLVSQSYDEIMDLAQQYENQNDYDSELIFDDTTTREVGSSANN